MCGIAGIWTNQPTDRVRSEVADALHRIRHRGPDDNGIWLNHSGLALGHVRLSIVELSPLGHQPMHTDDGRFTIVFNGEIYNHDQIRRELESAGHRFRSRSDTEVILHAYAQWGSDAVQRFIGMFAFGIWDQQEQTLELVRDRIGVKPLYFGIHGDTLCFASELKALRAFGHWQPRIDRQALGEYLQYGYISDDRSIFEGIHKLRPGHRLRLRRSGRPSIEPYWSVLPSLSEPLATSEADLTSELEDLLVDATRLRMVADVPVGVYLSGGVDSSLVTAILAKHHGSTIRTFTIGFSERSHDESRWARRVADHCGTVHTEYILDQSEALRTARKWGDLFDEPFGDSSGIPTLLVSQLASKEVKVVLSADGGDELFSGYGRYGSTLRRVAALNRLPRLARKGASAALGFASGTAAGKPGRLAFGERARKTRRLQLMLQNPTLGQVFDVGSSYWLPDEIQRLLGTAPSHRPDADAYPGDDAQRMSLWDFQHYLPEDILTKVDRTTMAVSIEGREPLLDHRLAEFAFRLPLQLRRGQLGAKHALKSILYKYVPREFVDRPKQGFAIPLDNWLRTELRELLTDYLSEERIRAAGLMDPAIVTQLTSTFLGGRNRLKSLVWFLVAFEMWRERWE